MFALPIAIRKLKLDSSSRAPALRVSTDEASWATTSELPFRHSCGSAFSCISEASRREDSQLCVDSLGFWPTPGAPLRFEPQPRMSDGGFPLSVAATASPACVSASPLPRKTAPVSVFYNIAFPSPAASISPPAPPASSYSSALQNRFSSAKQIQDTTSTFATVWIGGDPLRWPAKTPFPLCKLYAGYILLAKDSTPGPQLLHQTKISEKSRVGFGSQSASTSEAYRTVDASQFTSPPVGPFCLRNDAQAPASVRTTCPQPFATLSPSSTLDLIAEPPVQRRRLFVYKKRDTPEFSANEQMGNKTNILLTTGSTSVAQFPRNPFFPKYLDPSCVSAVADARPANLMPSRSARENMGKGLCRTSAQPRESPASHLVLPDANGNVHLTAGRMFELKSVVGSQARSSVLV